MNVAKSPQADQNVKNIIEQSQSLGWQTHMSANCQTDRAFCWNVLLFSFK